MEAHGKGEHVSVAHPEAWYALMEASREAAPKKSRKAAEKLMLVWQQAMSCTTTEAAS